MLQSRGPPSARFYGQSQTFRSAYTVAPTFVKKAVALKSIIITVDNLEHEIGHIFSFLILDFWVWQHFEAFEAHDEFCLVGTILARPDIRGSRRLPGCENR